MRLVYPYAWLTPSVLCVPLFFIIVFIYTEVHAEDIFVFSSIKKQQTFIELTHTLRCVVCQNQSLADSDAPMAQNLRVLIHDQLEEGVSPEEIKAFLASRYGTFILYDPPIQRNTVLLWAMPGILLSLGVGILLAFLRRR